MSGTNNLMYHRLENEFAIWCKGVQSPQLASVSSSCSPPLTLSPPRHQLTQVFSMSETKDASSGAAAGDSNTLPNPHPTMDLVLNEEMNSTACSRLYRCCPCCNDLNVQRLNFSCLKKERKSGKVNNCCIIILFLRSLGHVYTVLQLPPVTIVTLVSYGMFFNDEVFLPLFNVIFQQLVYFWDSTSSHEIDLLYKVKWLSYCAHSD